MRAETKFTTRAVRWAGAGALLVLLAALPPLLVGGGSAQLTQADKFAIVQNLVATVGVARQPLPPDQKGIEIDTTGKILNLDHVRSEVTAINATRVGARLTISAIDFKDDRIVFTINGGPHKTHWYNHLSVSVGGAETPVAASQQTPGYGTQISLCFKGKVPHLTPQAVRNYLSPLIDWDPPSKAEVMVQRLPAPVKQAINDHQVLVGMNEDMVIAALGRTGNKDRETDPATGQMYEDWIYGDPPKDTIFVRFVNERVVRVTTFKASGEKIVEDKPDPSLVAPAAAPNPAAPADASAAAMPGSQPDAAPTLRRPGDAPAVVNQTPATTPVAPGPGTSNPDGFPEPGQQTPAQTQPGTGVGAGDNFPVGTGGAGVDVGGGVNDGSMPPGGADVPPGANGGPIPGSPGTPAGTPPGTPCCQRLR